MFKDFKYEGMNIGIRAGHILMTDSLSAIEAVALYLYDSLKVLNLLTLRVYIADEKFEGLEEVILVDQTTLLQGNDYIPVYQLPKEVLDYNIFQQVQNDGITIIIPLYHQQYIIGMIQLVTPDPLDSETLDVLSSIGKAVSAGIYYQLKKMISDKDAYLFNAVMKISQTLQSIDSIDELLHTFSRQTLELLKFDRVTIFVFDYESRKPVHNLCSTAKGDSIVLDYIPQIPVLNGEMLPLQDLSGYWIPLKNKEKDIGCILVDNIYTLCDISSDSIKVLTELCSLMSLIIDNIKLFENIRRYAHYDDLTGIYNRRMGLKMINRHMKISKKKQEPLTICYMDLNNLKSVNDTYGHTMGDDMLLHFVSVIKDTIRKDDIISRMGGDEFIIIFPGCTLNNAEHIWEKIIYKMNMINSSMAYPYHLSSSHGMIQYDLEDEMTPAQLLSLVDHIMYKEKELHRRARLQ